MNEEYQKQAATLRVLFVSASSTVGSDAYTRTYKHTNTHTYIHSHIHTHPTHTTHTISPPHATHLHIPVHTRTRGQVDMTLWLSAKIEALFRGL